MISWTSKKQRVVAHSSTHSEYKALAQVTVEVTWWQSLLHELGISLPQSVVVWCNNLGATTLVENLMYHSQTKHIEIDVHFIEEKVAWKELEVRLVPTVD